MDVNDAWLSAFVAFAEHRSFTRAARALHLSQPALFVQVQKLTEAVGRPLYVRHGRVLELTAWGEQVAAFGRQQAERRAAFLAELRGEAAGAPVVLAAGEGAYLYLLGAALLRFPKDRWPLRLTTAAGPEAVAAVRAGRAHVAAAALDAVPGDLVARRIARIGQAVILPRRHRLARRRSIRPADLAGEALIVAPAGRPHRALVAQALADVPWTVALEASGWPLMLRFAALGAGLAIVNDFCSPPRGMVAIPLAGAAAVDYHAVTARGDVHPGAARLVALLATARGEMDG